MDVRPLQDEHQLSAFLAQQPHQPFLQSWAWGEFQQSIGRRVWRLGAFADRKLVGAATVIEHALILGRTYLYCPRGPLAASADALRALLQAVEELGTKENAMYVKVDPPKYAFPFSLDLVPQYSEGTTLQPRQTLLIDVRRDPAELLAAMHQKTRYNIRLSEKRGVTVRWSTTDDDFHIFLQLLQDTYARQGIRTHREKYYFQLFDTLRQAKMTELLLANYHDQTLVANLVVWSGTTVTYLHGGSSSAHKEFMAPHLAQWRTIEHAHLRGYSLYDLWGIAPENHIDHRWAGVTRFKKGFGGWVEVFPPGLNAILQPSWYWMYRTAKRMRGGFDD